MIRTDRATGFTLLEILVAFIVLAVVGGALLHLFHGGLRNVSHAKEYTHAALLARSKLAELNARLSIPVGEESGQFDESYRWQLSATPYVDPEQAAMPSDDIAPIKVTLAVVWGEADDERRYLVETLFLSIENEAGGS